jgi:two-component system CheB/CheR fusion protein
MFHYALRPGGLLFLGSSEAVGTFGHLFEPLDKKWKIFRRKEGPSTAYISDMSPNVTDLASRELSGTALARRIPDPGVAQSAERALVQHLVPPAILMHERGEIVHIHGRTGQFLEPAPGPQTSANVYNMARDGLQLDLAVAVRHAAASENGVVHRGIRVETNGHAVTVDLRVKKLTQPELLRGLFLVAFERAEPVSVTDSTGQPERLSEATPGRVAELERELQHAKEIHQSTIEELETANEELKSTNEELQSTNEELQSANEELETSKEEMQSLNEELQTVNAELQGKVEELSRANDDMKNLLNGTDIATIFLDNELNIKRYTDQAKKVVRLIPSDVGRPVGDLVSKLKHQTLATDAVEVLQTLVFKEAELQTEDGAWYLMRMLPYRTTDNVIDGLVVTFVDITKIKGLQEDWRRLIVALASSPTAIFGQTSDLTYDWAFGTILGQAAERMIGRKDPDLFGNDGRALADLKREVIASGHPLRRRISLGFEGSRRMHDIYLQPTPMPRGDVVGVSGVLTALEEAPG